MAGRVVSEVVRPLRVMALVAVAACASASLHTAAGFREQNRSRLQHLTIGMSRDQVLSVMGTESLERPAGTEGSGAVRTERDTLGVTQVQIPLGARAPALYNPMRTATYEAGEANWQVLYYYVRMVEDDNQVTDDELEPVVLREGYLTGWGWPYWTETARAHGIQLEDQESPTP